MSVQVERLKKNIAELTIELSAERFEDAVRKAFNKSKSKFNIPDFRKGKAPRVMIEKMYGEGTLYEDATDEAINTTCIEAMSKSELEIVSRPEVAVDQIGKDRPSVYTVTVAARPEVTLGECKSIEVEKMDVAAKPEDVGAELKKIQEQSARLLTVEDRPAADGDQTIINLKGFVDDKTFDGGKVADCPLTTGSHSFIGTLEEQLAGKNIGEECEINITFPEEYHAAELAGKPATFKVTVKEIKVKELPELGDGFTGEVSEFDALDECKKDVEIEILERKQKGAASENESRVADKVVARTSMEIPDRMVENQIDNMVQDTAYRTGSQGLSMDLYMKYTGMTMEQTREQMKSQVLKRIQTRPVLEEVVRAENLQVPDERLDEEIAEIAVAYRMEADKLKGYMLDRNEDRMKESIAAQEVIDFLVVEARLV